MHFMILNCLNKNNLIHALNLQQGFSQLIHSVNYIWHNMVHNVMMYGIKWFNAGMPWEISRNTDPSPEPRGCLPCGWGLTTHPCTRRSGPSSAYTGLSLLWWTVEEYTELSEVSEMKKLHQDLKQLLNSLLAICNSVVNCQCRINQILIILLIQPFYKKNYCVMNYEYNFLTYH